MVLEAVGGEMEKKRLTGVIICGVTLFLAAIFNAMLYWFSCVFSFGKLSQLSASSFFSYLTNFRTNLVFSITIGIPLVIIIFLFLPKTTKGLSIISIILIGTVLQILKSFFWFGFYYYSHFDYGVQPPPFYELFIGILILLFQGILNIAVIIALFKKKIWTLRLFLILFLLSLLSNSFMVYNTLKIKMKLSPMMISPLLYLIFYAVSIYYLTRPKVKEQFK